MPVNVFVPLNVIVCPLILVISAGDDPNLNSAHSLLIVETVVDEKEMGLELKSQKSGFLCVYEVDDEMVTELKLTDPELI